MGKGGNWGKNHNMTPKQHENPNIDETQDANYIDANIITTRESRSTALARFKRGRKVDASSREWLRLYCADYKIMGYNARQIMEFMDRDFGVSVSHRTILNYINHVLDSWKEQTFDSITRRKILELSKIDNLEAVYWEAWRESKENKNGLTIEQEEYLDEDTHEFEKKVRKTKTRQNSYAGDGQFLKGVEWCIEMRCKIFGLTTEDLNVSFASNPLDKKMHVKDLSTELLSQLKEAYNDSRKVTSDITREVPEGMSKVPNKKEIYGEDQFNGVKGLKNLPRKKDE